MAKPPPKSKWIVFFFLGGGKIKNPIKTWDDLACPFSRDLFLVVQHPWWTCFAGALKIGRSSICWQVNWLVVSTHLKNISQIGSFPQVGLKIKNIWNHHLVNARRLDSSLSHLNFSAMSSFNLFPADIQEISTHEQEDHHHNYNCDNDPCRTTTSWWLIGLEFRNWRLYCIR